MRYFDNNLLSSKSISNIFNVHIMKGVGKKQSAQNNGLTSRNSLSEPTTEVDD